MDNKQEDDRDEAPGKKTPDNMVPNPHSLPYASDLAAPVIKPNMLGSWKAGAVHSTNNYFKERFDSIKEQAESLAEDVMWNEIIFNSELRFKPVMGKEYHLYVKDTGKHFMSLYGPTECTWGDTGYKGTFRLNYDNRWEIVKLS